MLNRRGTGRGPGGERRRMGLPPAAADPQAAGGPAPADSGDRWSGSVGRRWRQTLRAEEASLQVHRGHGAACGAALACSGRRSAPAGRNAGCPGPPPAPTRAVRKSGGEAAAREPTGTPGIRGAASPAAATSRRPGRRDGRTGPRIPHPTSALQTHPGAGADGERRGHTGPAADPGVVDAQPRRGQQ